MNCLTDGREFLDFIMLFYNINQDDSDWGRQEEAINKGHLIISGDIFNCHNFGREQFLLWCNIGGLRNLLIYKSSG